MNWAEIRKRLPKTRGRLLPATIGIAGVVLAFKLAAVWEQVGAVTLPPSIVTEAQASSGGSGGSEAKPADHAAKDGGDSKEGAPHRPVPSRCDPRSLPPAEPPLFTPTETQVLQQLADRRKALDDREHDLEQRTAQLSAGEVRIEQKIAELKNIQGTLDGLIKSYDEQQEKKLQSLTKIYESMKPKDAARIFEELDIDTLLPVAERMGERKLAPVMADMDPKKAKEMTIQLARLRELLPLKERTPENSH